MRSGRSHVDSTSLTAREPERGKKARHGAPSNGSACKGGRKHLKG